MLSHLRLFIPACLLLIAFSACNKMPDHAKYIPNDAVVVAGVNTKEIGKNIAWSALIGSKLFDEIMAKTPQKGAMEGLGHAGIRHASTSYLYVKSSKLYEGGARITALVPLEDETKWENYVKITFPDAAVKTQGSRKEAKLVEGMYAGWTKDLLIIMNIVQKPVSKIAADIDTTFGEVEDTAFLNRHATAATPILVVDDQLLSAEMDKAFTPQKENAITRDNRFEKLETEGHDITVWINYDALMSQNADKMGLPSELALGNTLWKDAALACGFNFEKGKITGDMRYYTSEELREAAKEFGKASADKDLLDRLPAQNTDVLMSFHLSTKGLKTMLEKIGVLGFANLALSSDGISTGDFFEAFTGDMGLSVNDFKMNYTNMQYAAADSFSMNYSTQTTDMNFVYALKIGNKEKFNKIIQWLTAKELLKSSGNNVYTSPTGGNTELLVTDNYIIVADKPENAQAFAAGKFKDQPKPAEVKEKLYGHPMGLYISFQSILDGIQSSSQGFMDSVALNESRKLLDNLTFSGGEFTQNAFVYHGTLNFMNKEENAIFQLMNFALRMNEARETSKRRVAL